MSGRMLLGAASLVLLTIAAGPPQSQGPPADLTLARLKYGGGGDWYSNPTSLPNLARSISEHTTLTVATDQAIVEPLSEELGAYPVVYMNGHGNIRFTDAEVSALRSWLEGGGFLFADDNYGMDESFRREIARLFPDRSLVELPFDHPIYHTPFEFGQGLPKVHEHDGGPPHGYGIVQDGRLVVFYSRNTDLGDGWEDPSVHGDPEPVRQAALRMGTNVVLYAITH
jgi:hypothetical protein